MDNRIDIFEILKREGKLTRILIYPATCTINDPFEKTTTQSYLNPIGIDAYVVDENFSSLKFKYLGEIPYGSKKVICELMHEDLLKSANKIQINDDYYSVYKDADRNFAMLKRENYLLFIFERKQNA